MKTKAKKYFVVYLSLILVLSNFSFAVTLAFCNMTSDNQGCACVHNSNNENSGLSVKKIPSTCCGTIIVELSNINILEVLNSYTGNYLFQSDIINTDINSHCDASPLGSRIYSEFSYHPPNSEIPILYSSLLI